MTTSPLPVSLAVLPHGACDAHVHVFMPDVAPYAADRTYTPGRVTAAELTAFLDGHGLARVVLVQPSCHGTDNRALLHALHALGSRARGVGGVDLAVVSDTELADLDAAGMRGIRLNLATGGKAGLGAAVAAAASRLRGSTWAIQIFAPLAQIVDAAGVIGGLDRPVILDHFAGTSLGSSTVWPAGIDAVVDLARNGPAIVKLSGCYRASSDHANRWPNVAPLARLLIETMPDRLIWGSDWPHTGGGHARAARALDEIEPFQPIDDRAQIAAIAGWCDHDETVLRRILVDTPARLFGWAATTT